MVIKENERHSISEAVISVKDHLWRDIQSMTLTVKDVYMKGGGWSG